MEEQTENQNIETPEQEIQERVTIKQVSMKWGLILGMVMIIYGMVLLLADLVGNQALGYVNYLFIAVLMYFAHRAYMDQGNGFMSYGEGLKIGVLMTVVGSLISNIFSYIYVTFVDDSMIQKIMDITEQKMLDKGLSDAQIDQAMSMTEKFMTPIVMFPIAFIFTVFFGFIVALVVSAITKKADPSLSV